MGPARKQFFHILALSVRVVGWGGGGGADSRRAGGFPIRLWPVAFVEVFLATHPVALTRNLVTGRFLWSALLGRGGRERRSKCIVLSCFMVQERFREAARETLANNLNSNVVSLYQRPSQARPEVLRFPGPGSSTEPQ